VRPHISKIAFLHRVLDGATILVALALAVAMETTHGLDFNHRYLQAGGWAVLLFLMLGGARQLYGSWRTLPIHEAVLSTLINSFWTVVILVFMAFLGKTTSDYSRAAVLVWFGLTPLLLGISRLLLRTVLNASRASRRNIATLKISCWVQSGAGPGPVARFWGCGASAQASMPNSSMTTAPFMTSTGETRRKWSSYASTADTERSA
jgi:putative colanic acid biosysnthesis UDP-glucose lipid carrier transferase